MDWTTILVAGELRTPAAYTIRSGLFLGKRGRCRCCFSPGVSNVGLDPSGSARQMAKFSSAPSSRRKRT
jgi:hypothetical protein